MLYVVIYIDCDLCCDISLFSTVYTAFYSLSYYSTSYSYCHRILIYCILSVTIVIYFILLYSIKLSCYIVVMHGVL